MHRWIVNLSCYISGFKGLITKSEAKGSRFLADLCPIQHFCYWHSLNSFSYWPPFSNFLWFVADVIVTDYKQYTYATSYNKCYSSVSQSHWRNSANNNRPAYINKTHCRIDFLQSGGQINVPDYLLTIQVWNGGTKGLFLESLRVWCDCIIYPIIVHGFFHKDFPYLWIRSCFLPESFAPSTLSKSFRCAIVKCAYFDSSILVGILKQLIRIRSVTIANVDDEQFVWSRAKSATCGEQGRKDRSFEYPVAERRLGSVGGVGQKIS